MGRTLEAPWDGDIPEFGVGCVVLGPPNMENKPFPGLSLEVDKPPKIPPRTELAELGLSFEVDEPDKIPPRIEPACG